MAKVRMMLSSRIANVTHARLVILAALYQKQQGEIVDILVRQAYVNHVHNGKLTEYLGSLEEEDQPPA